jgi:hypothetical protein
MDVCVVEPSSSRAESGQRCQVFVMMNREAGRKPLRPPQNACASSVNLRIECHGWRASSCGQKEEDERGRVAWGRRISQRISADRPLLRTCSAARFSYNVVPHAAARLFPAPVSLRGLCLFLLFVQRLRLCALGSCGPAARTQSTRSTRPLDVRQNAFPRQHVLPPLPFFLTSADAARARSMSYLLRRTIAGRDQSFDVISSLRGS